MDITTDIIMFTPEEQLTRKQQMKLRRAVDDADIPMMMLLGWGIGFLITGILWITLGVFIEADENEIWSFKALFAGLLVIGISVLIGLIAKIYWLFSQRKSGTLYQRLNGFGVLLAIIAAFSGCALGVMVVTSF